METMEALRLCHAADEHESGTFANAPQKLRAKDADNRHCKLPAPPSAP